MEMGMHYFHIYLKKLNKKTPDWDISLRTFTASAYHI